MDFTAARQNMVEGQVRTNKVIDEDLIAAMRAVPREQFLPASLRGIAYVDEDLPLGKQRYAVEPMVLARLLQSLELDRDAKLLVIGTNGGYSAAVAARLVDSVIAVESDEALMAIARDGWRATGATNVTGVVGPLDAGYAAGAPYDAILIEGGVEHVPASLTAQLAEGGMLACMFRGTDGISRALLMTERDGAIGRRILFDAGTPTLPGFERPPAFVF